MAASLQSLLRFLSQDAKIPLATAMSSVKDLQAKSLTSPEALAKAKPQDLASLFPDEKQAKQILTAAKRVSKKRAAGDDALATSSVSTPAQKRKKDNEGSFFSSDAQTPAELEASLALPASNASLDELANIILVTNRAPLVLAFIVVLLKYTMPEQPLSSRLSLAQAYVSVNSRRKAVSLGLERGRSAEEEGVGQGQPVVRVAGREVRVLRRWGYVVRGEAGLKGVSGEGGKEGGEESEEAEPALWALDLEALRKSNGSGSLLANAAGGNTSNLPIYTPQSARAYILKSFETASKDGDEGSTKKKPNATTRMVEKEKNLGMLLRAIDLLYLSWMEGSEPNELDRRFWGWYVKVRPDVENGVAGWGGKGEVKLSDILALRRDAT
ncbi:hypothetical protein MBLNU230_g4212t1 [Neophaeotheca triangularis]